MGTSGSWPNFTGWLDTAWGSGADFCVIFGWPSATNLAFGQNPPWYLDDLLLLYPKFFGPLTTYSGAATTAGSQTVILANTNGLKIGTFVQISGVPAGTIVSGIGSGSITISAPAVLTGSGLQVTAYAQTPVSTAVMQIYIALATASLQSVRWQEQWYIAMGWFVAHYLTLWLRSDAAEVIQAVQSTIHGEIPVGVIPGLTFTLSAMPPGGSLQSLTKNGLFMSPVVDYTLYGQTLTMTVQVQAGDVLYATWPSTTTVDTVVQPTASKVAAQGLANGVLTSKSVGDVSGSYQVLTSLESWGQWNLTLYGQQLATMAKVIGTGPMVIW